ncbi:MAG: zf-HC2 domain-containing protein [Oscillospiraceae bacterium]
MDNNQMNCEVVKDLIPLYSEGLCSDTSRAAVKQHIEGCDNCRKLLEMSVQREKTPPVPSEKNVFKKLSRRLKMNLAVMISLGVVLIAVLGVVGFLSIGQIVKGDGMVSFETISQSIEAKKLAKLIADKNFEEYIEVTYGGGISDWYGLGEYENIKKHNAAKFSELYNEIVGDRQVKKITAHSYYGRFFEENRYLINTEATIVFGDGGELNLAFMREADNRYTGDIVGSRGICDISDENRLRNGFVMVNYTDDHRKRFIERMVIKASTYTTDEDIDSGVGFLSRFFSVNYWEELSVPLNEFYKKGFTITDCTVGHDLYDEEYNRYSNIWITANDGVGTAVYKAKIYRECEGLMPPCDVEVYSDGCTDELTESLAKMFG